MILNKMLAELVADPLRCKQSISIKPVNEGKMASVLAKEVGYQTYRGKSCMLTLVFIKSKVSSSV